MSKHKISQINEDYVKYQNDRKQKKDSIKHLRQRLESDTKAYNSRLQWLARDQERLDKDLLDIKKLEKQIEDLELQRLGHGN